jgi:pyruvate formate lyase activating enzyme
MKEIIGKIHSIETCGTVDGPGIRFVVFTQGCPMRCLYCHNPDTWQYETDKLISVDEILKQYDGVKEFCKGGITVTGGEPLVQIDFVTELFKKAQELNPGVDIVPGYKYAIEIKDIYSHYWISGKQK